MLAMSDYRFTAFCPTDGEWKDLEFRELAEDARVHFRKVWGKKYQAVLGHGSQTSGARNPLTEEPDMPSGTATLLLVF
jgi:hypothetical protein